MAEVTGLHSTSASTLQALELFVESGKIQETNAANNELEQDRLPGLLRMAPQCSSAAVFMLSEAGRLSFNSLDVMTPCIITVNDSYGRRNNLPTRN